MNTFVNNAEQYIYDQQNAAQVSLAAFFFCLVIRSAINSLSHDA